MSKMTKNEDTGFSQCSFLHMTFIEGSEPQVSEPEFLAWPVKAGSGRLHVMLFSAPRVYLFDVWEGHHPFVEGREVCSFLLPRGTRDPSQVTKTGKSSISVLGSSWTFKSDCEEKNHL